MLRALGRRLTLLNVVISGAILLAMALIALNVAEGIMASQYESDMRRYMTSILSVVCDTGEAGVAVRLKVPDKYYVYIDDEGKSAKVISDSELPEDDVKALAIRIRADLEDRVQATDTIKYGALPDGKDLANSFFISSSVRLEKLEDMDTDSAQLATTTFTVYAYTAQDMYTYTLDGTSYRVVPTLFGRGEEQDMMLVFQDQTEELAARYRFRWIFALCIAGGLLLIVMGSLFLSSRAIKPVEESIKQQREFVAAASHELRTPVAALRANAEVLGDAQLGEYAPFLGSILDESDRMSRLVSDLLNLARADAGELSINNTLVDAAEIAQDAYALMQPLANQHNLRLERLSASALMAGDADRLRQILIALLDNAVRYTPEGGDITLSVAKSDHRVVIRVTDNGIGIPGEHKARVFDRFYRVDTARSRQHGGAGLGLSVVKQLVDMMKGSVRVYDREGGGCVFEVAFQALDADRQASNHPHSFSGSQYSQ